MLRGSLPAGIALVGLMTGGCTALDALLTPPPPSPPPPAREAPAPRVLTPAVQGGDAGELQRAIQGKIQDAERLAARLDSRTLSRDQQDTLATVRSFIERAKEGLTRQDYPAASTLADKALILAEELARQR